VVPRYTELIRQAAQELIEPLLDAGEAELVSEFTRKFPLRVISAMLGLPEGHQRDDEMAQWALALIRYPFGPEAALEARAKFTAMVDPLIEDRRREPRQDLISMVVHTEIDGEHLDDEAIRTFVRFLFPAGADTTYMGLGNVLSALLQNPELMDLARREPERRGAIVEEGLRWDSPIANLPRMASSDHDVEWNGFTLPAGVRMIYSIMSANRDPVAFPDPARFDPYRSFDKPPITFGFGTHFCIGNHLALLEMTTALDVLLERMPDLRLRHGATSRVVGTILRGPDALPACWSAS
jgi:cytochrome P450